MRSLSQKTRYALRALQHLARSQGKGPVLIATMARVERIPQKFLEAILLELKKHGMLSSKKGKGGGYSLARTPDQIFLGEIIRVFDGPLAMLPCAGDQKWEPCAECPDPGVCGTRSILKEVRDATADILDRATLAEVLRRSSVPALGYQI